MRSDISQVLCVIWPPSPATDTKSFPCSWLCLAHGVQKQQRPRCCSRSRAWSPAGPLSLCPQPQHTLSCSHCFLTPLCLSDCSSWAPQKYITCMTALQKRLYLEINFQYVIWHLRAEGLASKRKKLSHLLQQLVVSERIFMPGMSSKLSSSRQ